MIYVIYYDDVTRSGFLFFFPPPFLPIKCRAVVLSTTHIICTYYTHTSQSLVRFPGPFNPPRRRLRMRVCDARRRYDEYDSNDFNDGRRQ